MKADEILKKHEDENEMHFHEVDRKWIIEAMEEYAVLRQTLVSGMLKCASCENTAKKDGLDCYGKCHICTQAF